MKPFILAIVSAVIGATVVTAAADQPKYGNGRFGYWIDIPPGFSQVEEAANGDGGISRSLDGRSELRIWGGHITEGDFSSEVAWRIAGDKSDDWNVSYDKRTAKWASWSASKNDRIMYQRAIPLCQDQAAYFRLEYDRSQLDTLNSVVTRLVKSLRSDGECR